MATRSRIAASKRLLKVAAFGLLLVAGQLLALAHACEFAPLNDFKKQHSAAPDHQGADHGDAFCVATATVGNGLADTILGPLTPKGAPPGVELTLVPGKLIASGVSVLQSPSPRPPPHPLALYGRLRI